MKRILRQVGRVISYAISKIIKYVLYAVAVLAVLFALFSVGAATLGISVFDAIDIVRDFRSEHGDSLIEFASDAFDEIAPTAQVEVEGVFESIVSSSFVTSVVKYVITIFAVVFSLIAACYVFKALCLGLTRKRSAYYSALMELNKEYVSCFKVIPTSANYSLKCSSKREFDESADEVFVRTLLLVEVKKDLSYWRALNRDVSYNAAQYAEYRNIFTSIIDEQFEEDKKKRLFLSARLYAKYERRLISKVLLKPVTTLDFMYKVFYSPIIGEKYLEERYTFSLQSIMAEFIQIRRVGRVALPESNSISALSVPSCVGFPALNPGESYGLTFPVSFDDSALFVNGDGPEEPIIVQESTNSHGKEDGR